PGPGISPPTRFHPGMKGSKHLKMAKVSRMSGPIVEPEPDMAAGRGRSKRRGAGRWLRRVFAVAVLLALAPLLLTLLYLPPFMHPVSTLMLKDLATLDGYDRRWVSIDEV